MLAVVIPACNEESTIEEVLFHAERLEAEWIIAVINGCSDQTEALVRAYPGDKIRVIYYPQKLGVDIPRAIGAEYALANGAEAVLFLDGDMCGEVDHVLSLLKEAVLQNGVDMALTNCYPFPDYRSPMACEVLRYREKLNRSLGIFHQIGLASPSHGPHCCSRRLLEEIGTEVLAIPPLALAQAVKAKKNIAVAAALQDPWQGENRGADHSERIAQTIIGDCLYAQSLFCRGEGDRAGHMGYHGLRRFDFLGGVGQ